MKKILMSLLAIAAIPALAFAKGGDYEFCEEHPTSPICGYEEVIYIEGEPGPQGEKGDKGDQGEPGRDGQDGATGPKGDTGATGETGPQGEPGTPGKDGVDGSDGRDGIDGTNGADGMDGRDGVDGQDGENGIDGQDGKDADMSYVNKTFEYTQDVAAGNMAVSAIDFGTTCKGVTEIGAGIGHAVSFDGSSTAGALGIKHGMTDDNAVIVKGWSAGSDSYGVGAAITHKF